MHASVRDTVAIAALREHNFIREIDAATGIAPTLPGNCRIAPCYCRINLGEADAECPNWRPSEVAR